MGGDGDAEESPNGVCGENGAIGPNKGSADIGKCELPRCRACSVRKVQIGPKSLSALSVESFVPRKFKMKALELQ